MRIAAFLALDLFIIFNVVTEDETWASTFPLFSTDLLFPTTSDKTELVAIGALQDNVSFLIR